MKKKYVESTTYTYFTILLPSQDVDNWFYLLFIVMCEVLVSNYSIISTTKRKERAENCWTGRWDY